MTLEKHYVTKTGSSVGCDCVLNLFNVLGDVVTYFSIVLAILKNKIKWLKGTGKPARLKFTSLRHRRKFVIKNGCKKWQTK